MSNQQETSNGGRMALILWKKFIEPEYNGALKYVEDIKRGNAMIESVGELLGVEGFEAICARCGDLNEEECIKLAKHFDTPRDFWINLQNGDSDE